MDNKRKISPRRTAFVGVCIFFLDKTITIAVFAMSVMTIKNGAMKPIGWKGENNE